MHEQENPFAAPTRVEEFVEPAVQRHIVPATSGTRLLNYLIDRVIFTLFTFGIGFAIGIALAHDGSVGQEFNQRAPTDDSRTFSNTASFADDDFENSSAFKLLDYVITALIYAGFYILFEATTSRSPAKFLTGTIVVNENGGKPTFGQIVGRSFARIIPFEIFSFLGKSARGWHDTLSHTYVVKARSR
jgi:uncharacterized RDD family membrane protein YckC